MLEESYLKGFRKRLDHFIQNTSFSWLTVELRIIRVCTHMFGDGRPQLVSEEGIDLLHTATSEVNQLCPRT